MAFKARLIDKSKARPISSLQPSVHEISSSSAGKSLLINTVAKIKWIPIVDSAVWGQPRREVGGSGREICQKANDPRY